MKSRVKFLIHLDMACKIPQNSITTEELVVYGNMESRKDRSGNGWKWQESGYGKE